MTEFKCAVTVGAASAELRHRRTAPDQPQCNTALSTHVICPWFLFFVLVGAVLLPPLAAAQSTRAVSQPGTWQYEASLYMYLPTIGGTTTFPAGASSISVHPSEILGNLKFTFMGAFDVHNGPWGVFTDLMYLNLGASKSMSRDFTIGNIGLPAATTANLQLDMKTWIWTLAAEYRVLDDPAYKVDLLGGTRYVDTSQRLSWVISGNLGPIAPSDRSGSAEAGGPLWDAIIGVRGHAALGADRKWLVPFYIDGGGGDSNYTFQAAAGIAYAFQWGQLGAMWRYLDYDLSGNKIKSISFDGPLLGVTFRW